MLQKRIKFIRNQYWDATKKSIKYDIHTLDFTDVLKIDGQPIKDEDGKEI